MIYSVIVKEGFYQVEGKDTREAFYNFFKMVRTGKIPKEKLGHIGIIKGKTQDEDVAARFVPSLYAVGLLTKEDALANLAWIDKSLATEEELEKLKKADSWLWRGR